MFRKKNKLAWERKINDELAAALNKEVALRRQAETRLKSYGKDFRPPTERIEFDYHAQNYPPSVNVRNIKGERIWITIKTPNGMEETFFTSEYVALPSFTVKDLSTEALMNELEERLGPKNLTIQEEE